MKRTDGILLFSLVFIFGSVATAQTYHVELPRLADDDEWAFHLTAFSSTPKENLILPEMDTTGAQFFETGSWVFENDLTISVMVIPIKDGELLYIDHNNNEDLRDDLLPIFFAFKRDTLSFDMVSPNDSRQRVKVLLQRKPNIPDSIALDLYIDTIGNLKSQYAKNWGAMTGHPLYKGKRGTFYFDDFINVRRGKLNIANKVYEIGIFDWTVNGLFNDSDDVFIIDQNGDGDLSDPTEKYALNDVFTINNICLKIDTLNKYGNWVELITTTEQPTFYYLKKYAERISGDETMGVIDTSVWDISLPTIDGDTISLRDYRGKYLLLNFWGDWCSPCLAEIPFLVNAQKDYKSKPLNILSILTSNRFDNVKKIQREKGMNWPQLIAINDVEKQFQIKGWPTNILITPSGVYYRVFSVTPTFFALKLR